MAGIEGLPLVEAKCELVAVPRPSLCINLHLDIVEAHEVVLDLLEELVQVGPQFGRCGNGCSDPVRSPKLEGSLGVQLLKVEHSIEPGIGQVTEIVLDALQVLVIGAHAYNNC